MNTRAKLSRSLERLRTAAVATAALALAGAGCAGSSAFEEHYEAGRYGEALRSYEESPEVHAGERALFRSGVLYLRSDGEDADLGRARRQFERLLTAYPESEYRAQAAAYLALFERMDDLERRLAERSSTADSLRSEVRRLENRSGWLEAALIGREAQAELLQLSTERLRETLGTMEEEIASLREELERLKEIDLQPSG